VPTVEVFAIEERRKTGLFIVGSGLLVRHDRPRCEEADECKTSGCPANGHGVVAFESVDLA
jgi:hypothetical protein